MTELNMFQPPKISDMPDIAQSDTASHAVTLDWVGMSKISLPLRIPVTSLHGTSLTEQVSAEVQCYVNIKDPHTKGIHMSRLYLLLTEYAENEILTPLSLVQFTKRLLASHADISDQVKLDINFPLMLKRQALKSQYAGYKTYPCAVELRIIQGKIQILVSTTLAYSSTCPCSAALARQLLQQAFSEDFTDPSVPTAAVEAWLRSPKGSTATAHSQRSEAYAQVLLDESTEQFQLVELINHLEDALKTPVQTAVKREDEQEFAKLNGQNLMFCEDAARRIHYSLVTQGFVDFRAKVSHFESLHAHDAVSMTSKGVAGGLNW